MFMYFCTLDLVKTLQECLFQDRIDMTVRYNSATKELHFLDL